MTTNNNIIGNISTIIKYISMISAGYLIGYLATKGLNLPIDQVQLAEIISTIIFAILAYVDSRYPNTFKFLGNDVSHVPVEDILDEPLNPEYECDDDGC